MPTQNEVFKFEQTLYDWTSPGGQLLSGFKPTKKELKLINSLSYGISDNRKKHWHKVAKIKQIETQKAIARDEHAKQIQTIIDNHSLDSIFVTARPKEHELKDMF